MATISFMQNVVVKDKKKIIEIQNAIKNNKPAFPDIKPIEDNSREKAAVQKWFCR